MIKNFDEFVNESVSLKINDFDFYKSRTMNGMVYSFVHKLSGLEGDIYIAYGSFGRGSGQSIPYVDYLEFVEIPDDKTIEKFELFIDDNLINIINKAKNI